jgi:hypothetical protein
VLGGSADTRKPSDTVAGLLAPQHVPQTKTEESGTSRKPPQSNDVVNRSSHGGVGWASRGSGEHGSLAAPHTALRRKELSLEVTYVVGEERSPAAGGGWPSSKIQETPLIAPTLSADWVRGT